MYSLQRAIYKLGMGIPVSLPFGNTAAELEAYQDNLADRIMYMVTKAHAGEHIKQTTIAEYSD